MNSPYPSQDSFAFELYEQQDPFKESQREGKEVVRGVATPDIGDRLVNGISLVIHEIDDNMGHPGNECSSLASAAVGADVHGERPVRSEYLGYYASQSRITDPGHMAGLLASLPNDLAELRRVARGLVIHYRGGNPLEHGVPAERMREIDTRYVETMLARLAELKSGPLTAPRSPTERLVGCCRDFTVLFLAMARAQGIPIRARVGFATYLIPGYHIDHEVAEVWDAAERRWRLVDPELADDYTSPDGVRVDSFDLLPDAFLLAGYAWRQCRIGAADPESFIVDPGLEIKGTRGWPQIRHNLVHDLAALNKTEMLLWDTWSDSRETLTNRDLDRLDQLAEQTSAADPDVATLMRVYKNDPELQVPDRVLSEDPLGGPCREVSWLSYRGGSA
ncbi:transglutaminase [Leptodontidium sp. MPI-SDFR-AT-0119]|nr:transglutaminase [Leptodontidium sp. MPI-SDFR-AT-0119]